MVTHFIQSKRNKFILLFSISLILIIVFFQNCGELKLKPKLNSIAIASTSFQSQICSSFQSVLSVSKYTVTDLFVINLTVSRANGQFITDKNMNGLNDQAETEVSSINTVTISSADSDSDGLPDFIETLKGTNPYRDDALEDGADNDGIQNFKEIQLGTDPGFPDAGEAYVLASLNLLSEKNPACGAGQDTLLLRVDSIPILPIEAYADTTNTGDWDLSHGVNENILFIGYKTSPSSTKTGTSMLMGKILRVKANQTLPSITPNDFKSLP